MLLGIKIPDELRYYPLLSEDVNILIGENGSGKSYLLGKLAETYLHGNYSNVIAIANSIYDKFNSSSTKFYPLRARRGRRQTKETIKKALINMSKDDAKRIRFASRALEYIKYRPQIGFRFKFQKDIEELERKFEYLNIRKSEKERLLPLIRKYYNRYEDDITWLEMESYSFSELERYSLLEIFKWESFLVKENIITPLEIFLKKDKTLIPLLDASSGELALITTIIYISSIIDSNTVILIDEPENSLHPKWQREYIKTLMDIFYLYQPRFVIATHSPLIISGAELSIRGLNVFKAHNFEFIKQEKEPTNIEEIYFDFFDTTTPENRFLSNLLVKKLNQLSDKIIKINDFNLFIDNIQNSISDPRQIELLTGVKNIARQIKN